MLTKLKVRWKDLHDLCSLRVPHISCCAVHGRRKSGKVKALSSPLELPGAGLLCSCDHPGACLLDLSVGWVTQDLAAAEAPVVGGDQPSPANHFVESG